MAADIPNGINRELILEVIDDFDSGAPHLFGESTGYDILFNGNRYPPKAIIGLAAEKLDGKQRDPKSFKGGLGTKCFHVLEENGFQIITKGDMSPFPDEVGNDEIYTEGSVKKVSVNRYERDLEARRKCIEHYKPKCRVCDLEFHKFYGTIGDDFIHVHHTIPISEIGDLYAVNPISDLRPVCPNCHAMLHKRKPPFTIKELKKIILSQNK